VAIIREHAGKDAVRTTRSSKTAMDDFALASQVGVALVEHGHDVGVTCDDGNITVIIDKHVLRLDALEKELCAIAEGVAGVKSTRAKVGPHFHEANIYRRQNFELPAKVLLVDDEKEFVQTLSGRLQMREFGTAVASSGEEALSMVKTDEPEVMVLDLQMPGIDGIEVLSRLKTEHPDIEVIILTGHGTDRDRELAEELGAFAFLEKPVDIERLAKTMKAAYAKAGEKKGGAKR
jgi:CheY-like chemotaxis protein